VRLLRYYKHLGAREVPTGIGSGGSAPPTVVRIARDFDRPTALGELEASRRRGAEGKGRRGFGEQLSRRMTRGVTRGLSSLGAGRLAGWEGTAAAVTVLAAVTAAAAAAAVTAVIVVASRRRAAIPSYPTGFLV
jgi:hypothetical protein